MYRSFFIAKSNLKKKKGDALVLSVLIAIAVLLLYVSLNTFINMEKVVDQLYEKCRSADWYMLNLENNVEGIEEFFHGLDQVERFEKTPAYFTTSSKYGLGERAENSFYFLLASADETRSICNIYPKPEKELLKNEILLPYYFKSSFGCKEQEEIRFDFGSGEEYVFEIAGFVEDPIFANPLNLSVYKCYLSDETLKELTGKEQELVPYMEYKAKLKDGEGSLAFTREISSDLNKALPHVDDAFNFAFAWEAIRGGDTMMSMIGMGIAMVFAVLLLIITMVVIRFSIGNFCDMNLKNIGMLQASGYTARQITQSFVMEMAVISVMGSLCGILLGAFTGPAMGGLLASIMGISWNVDFGLFSALISVSGCMFLTLAITWISAGKYSRTPILDALRGGIMAHNFRRNFFPLKKSRQPLLWTLGMKSIFSTKLKNMGIVFVVMLLGFANCVGFYMYQNFVRETEMLMRLTGIEFGQAGYTGDGLDELGKEIENYPQVGMVTYSSSANVVVYRKDRSTEVTCDFWKEPEKNVNEMLLEGKLPEYDNEIVLTAAICESIGAQVGDTIYVEGTEGKKDYILTGIDQKINNMGRKALMCYEGAQRLNGSCMTKAINIYAKEGYSGQELLQILSEDYPDREVTDMEKAAMDSMASVSRVIGLVCIVLVTVTVLAVVLIVFLLMKTKIVRERKNYGISKALGFTTWQLCRQTLYSNLPIMAVGSILGCILCRVAGEGMIVACLSFCGIKKCNIQTDLFWMLVTVTLICFTAAFVTLVCCRKIRKIEPVKMLVEE